MVAGDAQWSLGVSPHSIAGAAKGIDDAGAVLARGLDACVTTLEPLGNAAWGDDDLGSGFFYGENGSVGFREARDGLLDGVAQISVALRGHAVGAVHMAQTYAAAESGDDPAFSWHPGRGPEAIAGGATDGLVKDDPPPSMAMQGLLLLGEMFLMSTWPRGHANGMEQIAAAFDELAGVIDDVTGLTSVHVQAIKENNTGAGIEAFSTSIAGLVHGNRGHLVDVANGCRDLAAYCRQLAIEIRAAKKQCEDAGIFILELWAAARLAALLPWGQIYQLVAIEKMEKVARLLQRALADARVRMGLSAATYVGGLNLVGQRVRADYGLQHGIDWTSFGESVAIAFAAGGAMGAVNRSLIKAAAGGNDFATFLAGTVPGRVATNTAVGGAINVTTDAAFNDGRINWGKDFLMAGGMAINGEVMGAFKHSSPPNGPPPGGDPIVGPARDTAIPARPEDTGGPGTGDPERGGPNDPPGNAPGPHTLETEQIPTGRTDTSAEGGTATSNHSTVVHSSPVNAPEGQSRPVTGGSQQHEFSQTGLSDESGLRKEGPASQDSVVSSAGDHLAAVKPAPSVAVNGHDTAAAAGGLGAGDGHGSTGGHAGAGSRDQERVPYSIGPHSGHHDAAVTGRETTRADDTTRAGDTAPAAPHDQPAGNPTPSQAVTLADLRGVRGIEPLGEGLFSGADLLIEAGPEGLSLHAPLDGISGDISRLAAVRVESQYGRPALHYRQLYTKAEVQRWGKKYVDLYRGTGGSGGIWDEAARSKLDDLTRRRIPFDRQLVDTGFERVSHDVWRYGDGDGIITAVRRGHRVDFYTPVDAFGVGDLVRTSRVIGVDMVPSLRYGQEGQDQPALRLTNGWMEYSLADRAAIIPENVRVVRAVTPADVGLAPVERRVEPSGFVIGGENPSELIRALTEINGVPIDELQAWMRPFDPDHPSGPIDYNRSGEGFLGPNDDLREVIARDNDLVRGLGLTHEEIAEAVRLNNRLSSGFQAGDYIGPGDYHYSVQKMGTLGIQPSPFRDHTAGSSNYKITNTETGRSIMVSDLTGEMIKYKFYQGPGTSYRTAPEDLIRVFPHLLEKAGGEQRLQQVLAEVDAGPMPETPQHAATVAAESHPAGRDGMRAETAGPDARDGGLKPPEAASSPNEAPSRRNLERSLDMLDRRPAEEWLGDGPRASRESNRTWMSARSLGELGELTARSLEGTFPPNPSVFGSPQEETHAIAPALAAVNRAGFVTWMSQPGAHEPPAPYHPGDRYQRPAVSGFADAEMADRLRQAVADSDLDLIYLENTPDAQAGPSFPASRRDETVVAWFGVWFSHEELRRSWYSQLPDEGWNAILDARQVTIAHREWGPAANDRFWRFLNDAVDQHGDARP